MENQKLKQGTRVAYNINDISGTGIIRGIVSEGQP